MVVCLSVAQASTYVFLLEAGYRLHASAPIFKDVPQSTRFVDPVVQALVLTDIVIGLSVSALLLAIAIQLYKRRGSIDPNEPAAMAG
jgi:multicomponent Na+:H+ antiporter subunit C